MFSTARLKLTILYSSIFFILFWGFSVGLYFLMSNFLQGSYITQLRERQLPNRFDPEFEATNVFIATTAGNVALNRLRVMLLYLNALLLFLIPLITWKLTGQTLTPLKEAHDRERQFVSDASHELKTPLSIMLGETDVTLSKPRKTKEYQEMMTSMKEEIERLIKLVENLLLLARSDQHMLTKTFQPVDIVDTSIKVIDSLQMKMKEKQLEFSFELPDKSIELQGNQALINQLIFNVLDNAIKYTPSKGKIGLKLSRAKDRVLIKVKDTGDGISSADQAKIFDRFYRVDSSRSITKGYGLGLSICRSIVAIHNGQIQVNSMLSKGSEFVVTLPISST